MTRISIDPVTRLEGHGRIEIFLDGAGEVANVYFQVPELRGFETFCVGRQAEEMPFLTSRICGVCPEAHLLASVKALDDLWQVEPPPAAKKLRELLYMAFFAADHTTHFFALGGPDLFVGPDAPPAERNLLGVVKVLGAAAGQAVVANRARNHEVLRTLGGRSVNPVGALPGGWSKPLAEADRARLEGLAVETVAFAETALSLFDTVVRPSATWRGLLEGDTYLHRTHAMGTVDARGRLALYEGEVRVVDTAGRPLAQFRPHDYAAHVEERTEPWTYLKFPFLKARGWRGFTDGDESGVYCAGPLARLNVASGLATPKAQARFEQWLETHGARRRDDGTHEPVHHRMATHEARLIELLYASERMLELLRDPEITSPEVRRVPTGAAQPQGFGHTEAPRGTLFHHYWADPRGVLTRVNLIVGTTHNHAAIALSLKRAAQRLIRAGQVVEQGLLNRIEMAFRLYDPCLSCATHALGQMPLQVRLRAPDGAVLRTWSQEVAS